MYSGIEFNPIISHKNHPAERKNRLIKKLKYWVAVLAAADIIYTIFAAMVIWNMAVK